MLLIISSILNATAGLVDKWLVKKGISRNDYFFYMCVTMCPFAALSVAFEVIRGTFYFELSIVPCVLIIFGCYIRYLKQHTVVGTLKHLKPYESESYMSLSIVLAYIIDSIIGSRKFRLLSLLVIFLIVFGVFLLSDARLRIKVLQKDLIIRILTQLTIGYIAHYVMLYWSNGMYLLVPNVILTLIFAKDYKLKYHLEHKSMIGRVTLQQTFGFLSTYFKNMLYAVSVTQGELVKPLAVLLLYLYELFIGKETFKVKRAVGVVFVLFGIFALSYIL